MAKIDLDATMDAIAARIEAAGVTERAYSWPSASVSIPCAIVGYPTRIEFDLTFQDGSDELVFPIWFLVGKVSDKAARKKLSDILRGATGIKDALDGNLGGVVQTARVTDGTIETVSVSAIDYLSARFDLEVAT
jgi:hypothetical protein